MESKWKYCEAGNIMRLRLDEKLDYRNGTAAFRGGAKVYLSGRYHDFGLDTIDVLGLTRGTRAPAASLQTKSP